MHFSWRRAVLGVIGVAILGVVLATATPQGRTGVKAAIFVTQVVPGIPIKPQSWFMPVPVRERVTFPIPGGQGVGDIYRPPMDGSYPGMILFLGVAPAGAQDPRVVNLGEALARSGAVVMFYWSSTMAEERIDAADVDNLVAAFQYLQSRPFVDPVRVGMGGFCVGASFSLIAASREEIRDSVSFVNAFGPYFDMRDLFRSIASETRFHEDTAQPWIVGALSRRVFQAQLIVALTDPHERVLMRRAFSGESIDLNQLSPQGRAVYQLFIGGSLNDVDEAMQHLPPAFWERMDEVSPRSYLDGLRARVLVMHDLVDNLVPSDESRRLVQSLDGRVDVYYTEFSLFEHLDPTRRVSPLIFVTDTGKLFLHMYNLLRVAT